MKDNQILVSSFDASPKPLFTRDQYYSMGIGLGVIIAGVIRFVVQQVYGF